MQPPPPPSAPMAGAALPTDAYASWGSRVGATLVRGIIAGVPAFIGAFLSQISDVFVIFLIIGYVINIAAVIRMYIQRGHLGYDVGDRVLGQTLVSEPTMRPVGSGMTVFIRGLAHILDALACYIGFLWPLWDRKRQTFADKIMTQVVIKADSSTRHEAGDLVKNAYMLWTPVIKE